MTGLAAFFFPAVLMLFALAMERVQARLDRLDHGRLSNSHAGEVVELLDDESSKDLGTDEPASSTNAVGSEQAHERRAS